MIVFGDRTRARPPAAQIHRLRAGLAALPAGPAGIQRHAALVSLLVAGGELVQGLADAAFVRDGCDRPDAAASAAMGLALVLARAVWRSHASAYAEQPLAGVAGALDRLERAALPDVITLRAGEGFQHYAVYPETYAAAAAVTYAAGETPLVVGIRSIGATLAAALAGALPEAAGLPLTVRPIGPPFERRLALGEAWAPALAAARGRGLALADEGPGLSGSSFAAVLDVVERAGVPDGAVRVFPSHGGDVGGAASPRVRARWGRLARAHVPFEAAFLDPNRPGLREWVGDLVGPLDEPPADVAAGAWRAQVWADPAAWPPVIGMRERRKFLCRAGDERHLARFVGLGEAGEAAASRAEALGAAGFSPPVLGVRHGFLVSRWEEGARLWPGPPPLPRARLIERVVAYLGFRADRFAPSDARRDRGAIPAALLEMAQVNAAEAGAAAAAARLDGFVPWLEALSRAARPLAIDGRPHAWEWLLLPDGRLWKTDASDHCDGHDPIGFQDLAWDVAGASFELGFDGAETAALCRGLGSGGHPIEPEPLAFYRAMYLGFQLGLHASAVPSAPDAPEAERLSAAAARYRRALESDACSGIWFRRP